VARAEDVIDAERRLWEAAGDRDAYAAGITDDAVHVFPGWGIVGREPVLEAIASASPWESYTMDDLHVVELGPSSAALVYKTRALRAGAEPYEAAITSVYVERDGAWRLAVHQQTPL
jgi:uncharacterized protein (TIGR02246 family)